MIAYYAIVFFIAVLLSMCFLDLKGQITYIPLLVIMYFLFAFMKSNVDIGAYLDFYSRINSIKDIGVTDPGFGLLMYSGKLLGLDYFGFLKYLGILGLLFISVIFQKYSELPSVVLALYFIFDFSAEIIQVRAFIAEAVIYLLILDIVNKNDFNWRRFFVLLVFAILFHSTSVFFVLLILPQIVKKRRKLIFIVAIVCLMVPLASTLLRYIPIPILRDKLQYYVISQRASISIVGLLYVCLFLMITGYINSRMKHERNLVWYNKLGRLLDIHIISIIACVLLLYFSSNFYRILRTVMVVDFIVVGNYFVKTGKINKIKQVAVSGAVLIFFIIYEIVLKAYYSIMIDNSIFVDMFKLL